MGDTADPDARTAGTREPHAELLRRAFEAFNSGDADRLADLIDPEFEFVPFTAMLLEGTTFRGLEGMRRYAEVRRETWGDSLQAEMEDAIYGEDWGLALGRLRARGLQSGVEVDTSVVFVVRFRTGRLLRVEGRQIHGPEDLATALADVGLPPDAFAR